MFASKDLFDGGEEVDVDASGNAEYQNARPMTGSYLSSFLLRLFLPLLSVLQ